MKKLFILFIALFGIQGFIFSMLSIKSGASVRNLSSLSISQDESQQLAQNLFDKIYEKNRIKQYVYKFFTDSIRENEYKVIGVKLIDLVKKHFDTRYKEFRKIFVATCSSNLPDLEKLSNDEILGTQIIKNFNGRIDRYLISVIEDVYAKHKLDMQKPEIKPEDGDKNSPTATSPNDCCKIFGCFI